MISDLKGVHEQVLVFGPFKLFRSQKRLLESGRPVRLGSRALEILIVLVERAGEVVSKQELIHYAWPDTVVEENNLRVHLAALRKNMGDGHRAPRYIINVAGRGYSFIAPVNRIDVVTRDAFPRGDVRQVLAGAETRFVGRDAVVNKLWMQVPGRRLVTIVGPGGVGKTAIALVVAEQLTGAYDRVCAADLSATEDPALVPSVLGTAVGVLLPREDPIAALVLFLKDKRALIVLDNCEHVIHCVAEIVERIIIGSTHIDILATSREPLLARGEFVFNVAPLDIPTERGGMTAREALRHSAVELFVDRAGSGLKLFELTDSNAAAVVGLCRRLDGIPLAIELVAARVSYFGVAALAGALDEELFLAATGKRTARCRHRSLRSTLEWSYQILSPVEQMMLRRLAVFRGWFTADSAIAVTTRDTSAASALDALMSLVSKSLLASDLSALTMRYRLLHTTRAYASTKLKDSDERDEMPRRHAEHIRALLEEGLVRREEMTRHDWLAQYSGLIDDVRAAHDWAFAPGGNVELGAALTVAALPIGFHLALIDETLRRATYAMEVLADTSASKATWKLKISKTLAALLPGTGTADAQWTSRDAGP